MPMCLSKAITTQFLKFFELHKTCVDKATAIAHIEQLYQLEKILLA